MVTIRRVVATIHNQILVETYIWSIELHVLWSRDIKLVIATNEIGYRKVVKDVLKRKTQGAIVSHGDRYDSEKNVRIVLGLLRHVLAIDEDTSMYNVLFHLN